MKLFIDASGRSFPSTMTFERFAGDTMLVAHIRGHLEGEDNHLKTSSGSQKIRLSRGAWVWNHNLRSTHPIAPWPARLFLHMVPSVRAVQLRTLVR